MGCGASTGSGDAYRLAPPGGDAPAKRSSTVAPKHERQAELFIAVNKGNAELVRELLIAGVPASVVNEDGNTPLIKAVQGEHDCLEVLLEVPCNVEWMNNIGKTALAVAI